MHVHPTTTTTIATAAAPATRPTLRGAVLGTASAVAATTGLFALGAIGTDVQVVTGWAPDGADLRYGEVVATVALAVVAGAGLLALLERWSASALRTWTAIAVAVTVLSTLPLWRLEVDAGSKLWLTAMHLATGACAIAAQTRTHHHA